MNETSPVLASYNAVAAGTAWIDRSDRARLDVLGPDRAKFLHNLTTNDVKRLAIERGQEAFVTSPQGKTLGYVTLLACEDRILVRTDPGALGSFLPHLQKYGVFDDVTLEDVGARTFEYHLAGPRSEGLVRALGGTPPEECDLCHRATLLDGVSVRLVREAPTGWPGLTVLGDLDVAARVRAAIERVGGEFGLVALDLSAFEALRIEAGTPVSGRDVTAEHLPQEVGRDARAINFVKGCYLGQETVARLDALGHVNKLLKGLRIRGERRPTPGAAVEAEGKVVGAVTSSADSPGWGGPVALAYVRVAQAQPGTEVRVEAPEGPIEAVVSDLPMPPPTPGNAGA